MSDIVNRPAHYTQGGVECIDAIKASMTQDQFHAFLKGQVIKYLWRFEHKGNPIQDLQKAQFYMNRLVLESEISAVLPL